MQINIVCQKAALPAHTRDSTDDRIGSITEADKNVKVDYDILLTVARSVVLKRRIAGDVIGTGTR